WATEPLDLLREVRKLRPTVVHFSGHGGEATSTQRSTYAPRHDVASDYERQDGESQQGVFLQGPDGGAHIVSGSAIAETFGSTGSSVKLVVLNACYSE